MRVPPRLEAIVVAAALVVGASPPASAQPGNVPVLEIRAYTLKPGTRAEFHRRTQERDRVEAAFYASSEWQRGPRAAVLAAIDTFSTILVRVDASTLGGLRRSMETNTVPTDHATLLQLNADYVAAVEASDVRRFEELLAPDFRCSLPDGSLIGRAQFLERTAKPAGLHQLQAHEVEVRILGDIAIVHARTSFRLSDGRAGTGRYTDVWARRNGRWLAVAAHVTRH